MAGRKTACCSLSVLEVTLSVLFVIMTGVCVTLLTLMFTTKTHTGDSRHTPRTGSQTESERLLMFSSLSGPEPPLTPEHKHYLIGMGRADCTGPPAEIPLVRTEHITSLQLVHGTTKC